MPSAEHSGNPSRPTGDNVTEQQPNSGGLTLVVETPNRVDVRMFPAATPLDPRRRRGAAAEEAAHDAVSAEDSQTSFSPLRPNGSPAATGSSVMP